MKKCIKCREEKGANASFFYNHKTNTDGLNGTCKECNKKESSARTKGLDSEYWSWMGMKKRCYDESETNYHNYGGRGIKVCERWLESYDNFINDMGKKPNKEYTLDRINNDENYIKENCRWATIFQQANNKRPSESGFVGVHRDKIKNKWRARITINGKRLSLGYFDDIDEAIEARKQGELKYQNK